MKWLSKIAEADTERIRDNISRLHALKKAVHELGYFVFASNSGGYTKLQELLEEKLVQGRPKVFNKLKSALKGENNQKIALDSPSRFQEILIAAEDLVSQEIIKEEREFKKLQKEYDN